MTITAAHVSPLIALIAGILILIMPRLLNYIVAIYLILVGIMGLNAIHHSPTTEQYMAKPSLRRTPPPKKTVRSVPERHDKVGKTGKTAKPGASPASGAPKARRRRQMGVQLRAWIG